MKRRFEVVTGKHFGEDGTVYKKGDTIVTDKDLIKLFPQKFKDAGAVKEVAKDEPKKV